jgi:hypothetical protein
MKPLTIIMTSCDRWDLFTQTLDSFFALNTYPYVAFHVHNDSTNAIPIEIKQRYSDKGITWHEGVKRGLSGAWDYLVDLVQTEYFFNLEEDFEFIGNPNFIIDSFKLINICFQVWVRNDKDHQHPLGKIKAHNGVYFKEVEEWGDWCGFSFNPSLRSKFEWNGFFPNGINGKDEIELSREVKPYYFAYSLVNSACRHIGNGRHTKGFKI